MRVYISVDMEGIAGIAHPNQVSFDRGADRTDYDRSRALMAGETNAAIEACIAAGASEVLVNDSHWQMRNLRAEELHPAARVIVGSKRFSMTEGLDETVTAAAFVGYHAGAGNPRGVMAHTYSGATVLELRVNDVPHNEAGVNALRLGHHGVPVVLVTGDDALAEEIELLLPWAERVVVKRAHSEHVAESLSPERARDAIRDGMAAALGRLAEMPPYQPRPPYRLEVDLKQPIMAEYCSVVPGVVRIGPRTVAATADDGEQAFRWFITIVRMAGVPIA